MTIDGIVASRMWSDAEQSPAFEAMGAAERRQWSSFARQGEVDDVISAVHDESCYGVVVVGPWGVGKTTLARAVADAVSQNTYVVKLFGSSTETLVSYGSLALLLARLPVGAATSPTEIIHGIDALIRQDAAGKEILLVIDDLPGLDSMTVGVVMHLLLSGTAKALVLVRETGQLPEDLVWLVKDGMLSEIRLNYFTRTEVGELITKATSTFVSGAAVTALHKASNGVPLILQALFRDQVANGRLKLNRGGWVLSGPLNVESTSVLAQIVGSRLVHESRPIRLGIEKMALLGRAPLSVVTNVLGQETVWELEERGYLAIDTGARHCAQLRERYVGDIVRASLAPERMAELFDSISSTLSLDLDSLEPLEIMSLAAWTLDAGLVLEPKFGLLAATAAVRNFDPLLALRCTAQVPPTHTLRFKAALVRCNAYKIMADYGRAVEELNAIPATLIDALSIDDYAAWVFAKVGALLWVSEGYDKIPAVLEQAEPRLAAEERVTSVAAVRPAREMVRLVYLEFKMHSGEFAEIVEELEAIADPDGSDMGRNCACLLVPALSVLGREMDAVALGRRVKAAADARGVSPQFVEYCRDGVVIALIWSGKWRECLALLHSELENLPQTVHFRGGLIELYQGLAYAYAGRGTEAVEALTAATAQLEVRESNNTLQLAYSALAFAHAQVNKDEESMRYVAFAGDSGSATLWTNLAMAKFFRLMALRWLDEPHAVANLHESAVNDIAKGRYTTASMTLFGGTVHATDKEYALLEEVSLRRQGPMPSINVALARSCRTHSAAKALEAADMARELNLDAVESRCVVLALDFAKEKGENALARDARKRLEQLKGKLPRLPLPVQADGTKLTQRELQVATLAKRGLGNRVIADRIGVSVRTVEGHLYQVYLKLGITTRQELERDQDL